MASVAKREWTTPKGEKKTAWAVRYLDGEKHRSKSFRLMKDAQAYKRRVEQEMEAGSHIPIAEAKTIAQVAEMYVTLCEVKERDGIIGQSRLYEIKRYVKKTIIPSIGGVYIKDARWSDYEQCLVDLRKSGVTVSTLRKVGHIIKSIEEYASKRGMTRQLIASAVVREMTRGTPKPKVTTFNVSDIQKLLQVIEHRADDGAGSTYRGHLYRKCIIHLATFCGLRWGEICGLQRKFVDFDKRIIKVRHALDRWRNLKGPKTLAGQRDVPMPQHVVDMMREWCARFCSAGDDQFVFTTKEGQQPSLNNWHSNFWRPSLRAAGLWIGGRKQLHFHALRHFAASFFIESGMSLPRVARVLGHSAFDMTLQVYAHDIRRDEPLHHVVDHMATSLLLPPKVAQDLRTKNLPH